MKRQVLASRELELCVEADNGPCSLLRDELRESRTRVFSTSGAFSSGLR